MGSAEAILVRAFLSPASHEARRSRHWRRMILNGVLIRPSPLHYHFSHTAQSRRGRGGPPQGIRR
jgi:hypothetical protein